MTEMIQQTCIVCGKISEHEKIPKYVIPELGKRYLHSKAGSISARYPLFQCPKCGYVNNDLGSTIVTENIRELLNSETYRANDLGFQLRENELLYKRYKIVEFTVSKRTSLGPYLTIAHTLLNCQNTGEAEEIISTLRSIAIQELFDYLEATNRQWASKEMYLELADLHRQCGDFKSAKRAVEYGKALPFETSLQEGLLDYENDLIVNGNDEIHTIDEMFKWKKQQIEERLKCQVYTLDTRP